jgi:hypothetical protein
MRRSTARFCSFDVTGPQYCIVMVNRSIRYRVTLMTVPSAIQIGSFYINKNVIIPNYFPLHVFEKLMKQQYEYIMQGPGKPIFVYSLN